MAKILKDDKEYERHKDRSSYTVEHENCQKILKDIPGYFVTGCLNVHTGRSGKVFFGVNESTRELVAFKQTPLTKIRASEKGKKDYREEENVRRLYFGTEGRRRCENIADFRDVHKIKNDLFLITEYVVHPFENIPRMVQDKKLGLDGLINVFIGLCNGLEHVHKNMVHRDLKPSNVRYDLENGIFVPKIIDFGLACGLETSVTTLGTPGYAAPEQKRKDNRPTIDIYPVGVMLYEAVNGLDPYSVNNIMEDNYHSFQEVQKAIEDIENKDIKDMEREELKRKFHVDYFLEHNMDIVENAYIAGIIRKAMVSNPKNRYQSATLLKQDLQIASLCGELDALVEGYGIVNRRIPKDISKGNHGFDISDAVEAGKARRKVYELIQSKFGIDEKTARAAHLITVVQDLVDNKMSPTYEAISKFYFGGFDKVLNYSELKTMEFGNDKEREQKKIEEIAGKIAKNLKDVNKSEIHNVAVNLAKKLKEMLDHCLVANDIYRKM